MSESWFAPDSDKVDLSTESAGYPLAIHFPQSSSDWLVPATTCEDAAARDSGLDFAGLIQVESTTRAPWTHVVPASLLADMNGDGFPDQLRTDGSGGVFVRTQARSAPEHSLEATTWPYGEYPEGSSFLAWRSGDPLESPNLPFADLGIAEVVDGHGHRVWARAQCRLEHGEFAGCGIVAHQDHRGASTRSLHATRAELPGVPWLSATWDVAGRLANLSVTLPAGADLTGLDEVAPWFNPSWRDCAFAIGNGPADGSLLSYVQECLFHPSPWMPAGLSSSSELWMSVGQVASAWPYVDGLLGHGVQLLSGPSSLTPGIPGPHELFVSGTVYDPGLQVPLHSFGEGYAWTADDDLETESTWWNIGGQARLHAQVVRSPVTGEVFSHQEHGWDGWTPTSTTTFGGADSITAGRTVDPFGRTDTSTNAAGQTSTVTWTACGKDVATDPLGNTNQQTFDELCWLGSSGGSAGGGVTLIRDGLGAILQRSLDPDSQDPILDRWFAVDRDPAHFGQPGQPQTARSDGRSLDLTFRDVRGHAVLERSCRMAGIPAVPSDPSTYKCAPSTEVDRRYLFHEDGLPFASSGPHPPGEPATWMVHEQDSLGRPFMERPVLGTEEQVLGLAPGLELGPPVHHLYDHDRATTIGPTGLEQVVLEEPLHRTELLDGDVVAEQFTAADGAVLAGIDVMGRTSEFAYDDFRRRVQVTGPGFFGVDPSGLESVLVPTSTTLYDLAGRPWTVIDSTGGSWSVDYDPTGRPTHMWAPDGGLVTHIAYDDPARTTTLFDADGDPVVGVKDGLGRTVGASLPDGTSSSVSWDAWGGVASQTDPRGSSTAQAESWLVGGRVRSTITLDDGSEAVAFADVRGRVLRTVDRDEVAHDFEYDDWGRLVRLRLGAGAPLDITSWPDGEILFEQGHDALGRLSWRCPAGVTSGLLCEGMEYDARGRMVVIHVGLEPSHLDTPSSWVSMGIHELGWREDGSADWNLDPLGHLTDYVYDDAGHLSELRVDGQSLGTTVYDAAGRPVRQYHPDGSLSEVVLDDRGRVIERWDPGRTTPVTFGYRADGALQWTEDGDGIANPAFDVPADQWMDYDAAGRLVTLTSWNDAVIQYEYDGADLFAKTAIDPVAGVASRTEFTWDPIDPRLASTVTAQTVSCASDGFVAGSLSVCAPDEVAATKIAFTSGGRRLSFVDGEGHSTQWTWDPTSGRMTSELRESTERHLLYGVGGRLEQVRRGPLASPLAVQDLEYDPLGRLEQQIWKDLAAGAELRLSQARDLLGQVVWSEARQDGHVTEETYRDYDALGRPIQLGRNMGGAPPTVAPFNGSCDPGELCFDYDAAHRLEGTTWPDGRQVAFEYSGPLLDRVCEGASCSAGMTLHEVLARDDLGRPTETWRTGDVYETTMFDGGGLRSLQQIEYLNPTGAPGSGAALVLVDPDYDVFGRQTGRIVEHVGPAPFSEFDEAWSWSYDAAGRLSSETIEQDTTLFEWDLAGNRLSAVDAATGEGMLASYGLDNRLELVDRIDATGALVSSTLFGYDDIGQRLDDETGNSLTYSPHGRLASVIDPSGATVAEWTFGSDGRRLREVSSAGDRIFQFGPGSLHPFVVTENGGQRDVVQLGGTPVATLEPTSGPGKVATIQPALSGSVSLTADMAGEITWQGSWHAWGSPTRAEGVPPAVGWRGLMSSGPDLPYLAAAFRDYDPTTGTWLQQDPLGVDGGTNIYAYADGDPVNLSDPLGLCVRQLSLEARIERASEAFERVLDGSGSGEIGLGSRKGNFNIPLRKEGTCGQSCLEGLAVKAVMMAGAKAAAARGAIESVNQAMADGVADVAAQLLTSGELEDMWMQDPQGYLDLVSQVTALSTTLMAYEAYQSLAGGFGLSDDQLAHLIHKDASTRRLSADSGLYRMTGNLIQTSSGPSTGSLFTKVGLPAGVVAPSKENIRSARAEGIRNPIIGQSVDLVWGKTNFIRFGTGGYYSKRGLDGIFQGFTSKSWLDLPTVIEAPAKGLEAFAVAFKFGDARWLTDDYERYLSRRPSFRQFAGSVATVNRRWEGREPSMATVLEGTPLATASEVTRIAGGLAHLAAGAANLVGADRAAGAIDSLAEGANSAADAIDEANFGLSVLDPRDSEVLGALVINGPGAAVGSLVGLTRGARALGAVDDMARWGDDAGRLSLAGDAQGALSRTGGLDGGLGLVDDGAKACVSGYGR
jgi:RHS repeat-associated protein